jgi:hypothetical protein
MKKYILLPELITFVDHRGNINCHFVTEEELAELADISLNDCRIFPDFCEYLDYCQSYPDQTWRDQKVIWPYDFYDELEKKYLFK